MTGPTEAEPFLKLINEVFGLAAFENEIREVIGNTNWKVLAERARDARAAYPALTAALAVEAGTDEDRTYAKLETIVAPDNGTTEDVLAAVLACANAWVPEARIIGNVRAGDISRVLSALTTSPASSGVEGEAVAIYRGNGLIDCGNDGHHNIELLKLIPANTLLYAHPAPTPAGDGLLRLAVAAVLEADKEFRSNMGPSWEGDPLSDELDGLRRIFEALPASSAPQTEGSTDG
ncbi:hypothetical protein SAMN05892877_117102 [Rhizobium subbaraonis]|uniref:Uncharacterized protein n=1 Tax=Rhizobium subbaraonis TaxID=908946 RepID=A0A285UV97_9HYPH|nr:hypothetical protein [Rhizobium subbaraonis]SOC45713.1 hypothetical protein SAMN05892877_117102 [Rhizobium subbaraonis]